MAVVSIPVQGLQPGLGLPAVLNEEKDGLKSSKSWAAVLGNHSTRYENRNVLEVILEKDTKGSFIVSDSEC